MPLNNRDFQTHARPTRFPDHARERPNHQDGPERSVTPLQPSKASQMTRSTSGPSDRDQDSNSLSARDAPGFETKLRQKAISLKLNVPNPFESRSIANGLKAADSASSQEEPGWPKVHKISPRNRPETLSTFDNTGSIAWDDDSAVQEVENQTIVFRGDRIQATQDRLNGRQGQRQQQQQQQQDSRGLENAPHIQSTATRFGHGLEDEIAQGRKIFQQSFQRMSESQEPIADDAVSDVNAERPSSSHRPVVETPSRATTAPSGRSLRPLTTTSKTVSFDSPAIRSRELARANSPTLSVIPQTTTSTTQEVQQPPWRDNRMQDAGNQKTREADTFSTSRPQRDQQEESAQESYLTEAFESSRESDYPTSEDDPVFVRSRAHSPSRKDSPLKQESHKRRREQDLDFDMAALKTMPYTDLLDQKFDADPRKTTGGDAFDIHTNTKSLSQRLSNLNRMSEDEQRTIFRDQSDEEWSHIGSWFIDKFRQDLKRLMENKIERRKTSMRFENELRRRQTSVEWCLAGVEEDLKSLRKGGGELIKGRDTASRRNTPQKKA